MAKNCWAPIAARHDIIDFVREHECLYDHDNPGYNNGKIVEPLWSELSESVDIPVAKVKSLWKNLKDSYRVQKKKEIMDPKRKRRGPKWPFYEPMRFLDKYMDFPSLPPDAFNPRKQPKIEYVDDDFDSLVDIASDGEPYQDDVAGKTPVMVSPETDASNAREFTRTKLRTFTESSVTDGVSNAETRTETDPSNLKHVKRELDVRPHHDVTSASSVYDDPEATYGLHVAATLRTLTPRQKQMAKIKIEQIFYDLQFPEDKGDPRSNMNGSSRKPEVPVTVLTSARYGGQDPRSQDTWKVTLADPEGTV